MKVISTLLFSVLVSAPAAFAQSSNGGCGGLGRDSNGGCNTEPQYQWCYAHDAHGNTWKEYNYGVGSNVWAQYHVIRACRAQSPAPRTCRPAGCN